MVETAAFWSHRYAGGMNSRYLNQLPTLGYKQLVCKSIPYTGGTNSCFLNKSLCWRYKQLLSEATPTLVVQTYAKWYFPMLVILTPLTSPPMNWNVQPLLPKQKSRRWELNQKPLAQQTKNACYATMSVLLKWQTQCFIRTTSCEEYP